MKLILLGYMGSGKTIVGKSLANKLNFPFVDLDEYIEAEEKKSISEIFRTNGEIYFRKKELEILGEILKKETDLVLSLGGGTPCYGNAMQLLQETPKAKTVYLKTSLEKLTHRLFKENEKRPLIHHLKTEEVLKDFVRKHLFERAPIYEQAKLVIHTDQLSVEEIVEKIVAELF